MWLVNDEPSADAVSQGSAPTSAEPNAATPHCQRGRPAPGIATHTTATVAASSSPDGVRPASATQNASPKSPNQPAPTVVRIVNIAVATQGRHP
ncbi:Uncharacterised protein [Mycobacterium tuberculosis]|uniref:Uncharacterized protein n=1 Tax=Mycobacterium tuberculosis TaxID=1773 RepID=A0A655A5T9_MYCTX|nr:Uncharacterised protein [Mycobacterium tuberculosis]CKQ82824.1 Uncharacterised protein [Mycobacterium tuberculosis]CKR85025.1 Uncharacterised protein [Mycobacterium tuberculosis]CKS05985.1 Uncharacterised protein [Mycobacterium tuberculosis]CKS32805.1 Uncharacterised protein [Mycobacterium tuberculosis]